MPISGVFCALEKEGAKADLLKVAAQEQGVKVYQFPSLRNKDAHDALRALNADLGRVLRPGKRRRQSRSPEGCRAGAGGQGLPVSLAAEQGRARCAACIECRSRACSAPWKKKAPKQIS